MRSFLGKTGKVNRAIRETIIKKPEMFFAFNNGIAATALSVEVKAGPEGLRLLAAKDLQIVNGGQTTASLAFTRRKDGVDLSHIFVQMKLSVVDAEKSGELIPKISEFANKQNKVSDSESFSNHEFHRKLEEVSRRIKAPAKLGSQRQTSWFYERVKGQYRIESAKMSPAEKIRFEADNPRRQVITKTDLAKVENSWQQLPHEVSKGAQKNFDVFSKYVVSEWQRNSPQFNDEYFRTIVAHAIVFRELEQLIPAQSDWYDGGYRANVVTFSIAKLVQIINEQGGGKALNTQAIWKAQRSFQSLYRSAQTNRPSYVRSDYGARTGTGEHHRMVQRNSPGPAHSNIVWICFRSSLSNLCPVPRKRSERPMQKQLLSLTWGSQRWRKY